MASRYVKQFCNADTSQELAEAVRACYKGYNSDIKEIFPLEKQRVFAQNLDTARPSDVLKRVEDNEDSWDFEGMVTAEDGKTPGIRGMLQKV